MVILGIRTSPTSIRYALLEWDGQSATFVNSNGENKLDFPAGMQTPEQKLYWLYQELERVLRQHSNADEIVIKMNEYVGRETSSTRLSAYLDAVVMLHAGRAGIPVKSKLYQNIGTRRSDVKNVAEENVGSSSSYWNEQMADAVVAAWSERR